MIIGHFPAGYLAAVGASRRWPARTLFLGVLVGSVLPDIDMLRFFFLDEGAWHHHAYFTHRPILWVAVLVLGAVTRKRLIISLGLGGLLHMLLDTFLGKMAWGWPLTDAASPFIVVQPTHSHWLFSFMAHWTFLAEVALVILAAIVFLHRRSRRRLAP